MDLRMGERYNRYGICKSESISTERSSVLNNLCVFISLIIVLADSTTDVLVLIDYCNNKNYCWGLATMIFIAAPNLATNMFSYRWFTIDKKISYRTCLTHGFLIGVFERYITYLFTIISCKDWHQSKCEELMFKKNDLSLLHFLYVFIGTVPQMILYLYALLVLQDSYEIKVFSLIVSSISLFWGCGMYLYRSTTAVQEKTNGVSFILKLVWHLGIVVSRIFSILLFIKVLGIWTLVLIGIHWFVMTFWIIVQKTTFCPNKLEETFYNIVMGFVYCFCYINLQQGHTKYRLLIFYTFLLIQNFSSLLLYGLMDTTKLNQFWLTMSLISIIGGSSAGIGAMILYYKYFHHSTAKWKDAQNGVPLNNTPSLVQEKDMNNHQLRTFKTLQIDELQRKENLHNINKNQSAEIENVDRKILLEHWIVRSASPTNTSAPLNSSMDVSSIDIHTLENTSQSNILNESSNIDKIIQKKKIIPFPVDLILNVNNLNSLDKATFSQNIKKRRAICSSDELQEDINQLSSGIKQIKTDHSSELSNDTDETYKKTSSDSIDLDLDLSISDINSSDINMFNENIVQKLCLSALKNIKVGNQDADIGNIQRIALDILKEMYAKKGQNKTPTISTVQRDIETPTEMLSVHDYENICAVNIAREAWGLRSWNGYFDIENGLHDGSVVRDRSHDTFTSYSSEVSSCLSHELKSAILASPALKKMPHTYSNIMLNFDSNPEGCIDKIVSYNEEKFSKPFTAEVIKDYICLEPILEELDDLGDVDPSSKRLKTETSLVATIDEIHKATVTNSPRNLYHRRTHYDPVCFDRSTKLQHNLKRALWKEPCEFDSANIMKQIPEKENFFPNLPNDRNSNEPKNRDSDLCNHSTILKNTNRHANITNTLYNKTEQLQDLSNKNIDLLWQIVSENKIQNNSIEDLSLYNISSSLQSLIHNDNHANESVNRNAKKFTKSKPRRKFSILRERFEPKQKSSIDKELLGCDIINKNVHSAFVNPDTKNSSKNIDSEINEINSILSNMGNTPGVPIGLVPKRKVKF